MGVMDTAHNCSVPGLSLVGELFMELDGSDIFCHIFEKPKL